MVVIKMKIAGIIVEYNPLHNGHLFHIEETRRISKCDVLVAVMSGNYTQRGEVAMIDKFTRTKMALANQVDLVVELPFVFSVQSADLFAQTAVDTLSHMGVTDIYFGSEVGDIKQLYNIADVLDSKDYNDLVQQHMAEGHSYPTSSNMAMDRVFPNDIYHAPNNILGIQYILAGRKLELPVRFHTIKRVASGYYDDLNHDTTIQSATAIRTAIQQHKNIDNYVPQSVLKLLQNRKFIHNELFYSYLKYKLSHVSKEELSEIFGVTEGFENRLLKCELGENLEAFIQTIISKRYTNSRIKRMLIHILINTQQSMLTDFRVPYLRILGMNDQGKKLLHMLKKETLLPIITKAREGIHPYLDLEIQASKVYSLESDMDVFKMEFEPVIY